jgi:steroid 5-alpha reductase family enzyme
MKKVITPFVVIGLASLLAYALGGQSRTFYSIPLVYILIAYSLLVQVVASIPAIIFNTEKYYDVTGSLTFVSITLIAILSNEHLTYRQIIAGLMVFIWACRLGSFLFLRISKTNSDSRFVKIK